MRTFFLLVAWCVLSAATVAAQAPCTLDAQCADGDPCNGTEVCRNGSCQPGPPASDGRSCNTGNPCSNNDVCQGGVCVSGVARPDGSGCSDGNACNGRETCQAGQCTAGPPPANGANCGDNEPCNGVDTCQSGVCVHGTVPPEGSPCSDGFMCNGLETCHAGVCTPGQKAPDGLSCSDGKACNGVETCGGGICRSGPPPNCDDGDPCTTDACDNAVGGCKHIPKLDGASCSDGNFCNGKETCLAGKCIPDPLPPPALCEDGNSCNGVEYCDHGQCMPGTPLPNGSSCADSNICDGLETCQNGRCVAGTKLDCTSTSPCAVGSCDPFSGCTAILVPDGSPCDDNNVCNGVSTCHSGTCSPTTGPPSCGALACDPVAGCVVDAHITGTKLLLRARRGGDGLNVRVQTREAISTSMPPSSGTATDPVVHGGGLRVRSLTGGFDQSFALPKQNWKYLGEPGENKGYRYRSRGSGGAIRTVVVKDGKIAKASGSASGFPTSLATDPNPVEVTLVLGNQRYCMSFGGTARFEAERRFSAEDAPMAATCPP